MLFESAAASAVKQAVEAHGVDKAAFCNWRKRLLGEEAQSATDGINRDEPLGEIDSPKEKIAELETEARFRKTGIAVWKGAAELARKDPGINPERPVNKEKTILVDALRTTLPLHELLGYLRLARSSYHCQEKALSASDKYAELRVLVREEFEAEGGARGHRTAWARLRRREEPVMVTERVALRIMKAEGLRVPHPDKKKCSWSS